MDWALEEAKKYSVAMHGGSSTAEELNHGVTNIGSALHQWTEVMHKGNELNAKKDKKDTKRAKSGNEKLPLFIWKMIFHASELIPDDTMDDDSNAITARMEVVETYCKLLDCSMAGQMCQHLHWFLNDENDCSTTITLSTCVSTHMGKLRWDNIDSPEAFSILACYHWGASAGEAAKLGGHDAMSIHLRVTEGNGIYKADVKKAAKVVLLAAKDIDVLSRLASFW
jgi:hypothetical protein